VEQVVNNGVIDSRINVPEDYLIVQVHADNVRQVAELVGPLIDAALEHASGELTTDDILNCATRGKFQVWLVTQARQLVGAATTQVVQYPRCAAVRVVTLGGRDMDSWAARLDDEIQAFGREQGATRIEACGRKGLERKLRELAYIPRYTMLVKEIEHG
jgi:hypothetical protein